MKRVKMLDAPSSEELEHKIEGFLIDLDNGINTVGSHDCKLHYQATGNHHFCLVEYITAG